jgi:membrane-associated phospholipid phosphatase
VQIAVPILLADKAGMIQLAYIAVTATVATHGVKRLVNDWTLFGTRIGQRPGGEDSKHNAPSGHSSMASCAAYFVCRRYGLWYAFLLVPILLLTMYARVMLNDHTISAAISGALLGLLTAAIFTTKFRKKRLCPMEKKHIN